LNRIKTLKKNIIRRQDAPIIYENNASIYIWSRKAILKNNKILNKNTIFYEMPHERSIDIDSELDFKLVEFLLKKN
jgi:CMP-N-acetylneuraminic acid synthetase